MCLYEREGEERWILISADSIRRQNIGPVPFGGTKNVYVRKPARHQQAQLYVKHNLLRSRSDPTIYSNRVIFRSYHRYYGQSKYFSLQYQHHACMIKHVQMIAKSNKVHVFMLDANHASNYIFKRDNLDIMIKSFKYACGDYEVSSK